MPQDGAFYISDPSKERPYLVEYTVQRTEVYIIELDAEDASYAEALAENTWSDGHREEFTLTQSAEGITKVRIFEQKEVN